MNDVDYVTLVETTEELEELYSKIDEYDDELDDDGVTAVLDRICLQESTILKLVWETHKGEYVPKIFKKP